MANTKQRTRAATQKRGPGRSAGPRGGRRFQRRARQAKPTGPAALLENITARLPGANRGRGRSTGPAGLVQGALSRLRGRR